VTSLLEPGYRLDRYELLCKIGHGGMASVWLARTKSSSGDDVFVAIKTMLPELAANDELRKMMLDEARIVMAIDHPNVAATLEVGQLFDMPYLVLEYVAGESVEQLCDALQPAGRTVPPAIVTRLVSDAAAGLHAAHELVGEDGTNLGIVHRDVSPHNLLVDESGTVRLIDFGVAMARDRLSPATATGVMKGKVPYMAPEHALGERVDRRADVWALGAVAYVLLSGQFPFDGPNDATRLVRKLSGEPPSPLPSSVTPALSHVVMRALAPEREARYQTAADLAKAFGAASKPATHAEVAAFFQENLQQAMKARALIVQNALAAAVARARAREILDNPQRGALATPVTPVEIASEQERASNATIAGVAAGPASRPAAPSPRPWTTYVGAAAIALLVMLAFAMGSITGRNAASDPPRTDAGSGSAITITTSTASVTASALDAGTHRASPSPPSVTVAVSSSRPPPHAPAWTPPPPAGSPAPPASSPRPPATASTKRPPSEDTIF
jgi:serine/threonine-protein kinase